MSKKTPTSEGERTLKKGPGAIGRNYTEELRELKAIQERVAAATAALDKVSAPGNRHPLMGPITTDDLGLTGRADRVRNLRKARGFDEIIEPAKTEAPVEIVATHPPVHPGEILREEFMEPMGLTAYAIAKACKIPRSKLERIVREDLGISGDTAVRLGRFFGNSPQFWMNLQATYEVMKASQELGDAVNEIEPYQYTAA